MASTLLIGNLTVEKARSFINLIEIESEKSKKISIYIHSHGGSLRAYAEIAEAMLKLSKKGVSFIGLGANTGSTAMLIFLNCDERLVTQSSNGYIHLPVEKVLVSKEVKEKETKKIVGFIERRTIISEKNIYQLNDLPLSANDMVKYGIATKKVISFP
ncbi:MAG: ATP-dependent Clp protease proteolytic subunit [Candidatus Pacebacteria bacterium]|nr:ATP-dependent Clp protease proteolytic subunit [Candidatus Paceibacterota bacterium]